MHSVPSGEKPEDRRAKAVRLPHETESEIPEKMHETTSEPGCPGAGAVHEIKSEFREAVHEMESELRTGWPGPFWRACAGPLR